MKRACQRPGEQDTPLKPDNRHPAIHLLFFPASPRSGESGLQTPVTKPPQFTARLGYVRKSRASFEEVLLFHVEIIAKNQTNTNTKVEIKRRIHVHIIQKVEDDSLNHESGVFPQRMLVKQP